MRRGARLYIKIFLRYYLATAVALAISIIAVYAPLTVKLEMRQLLLPYSVNTTYVYRVWLGAGHYTVCVYGSRGVNITLTIFQVYWQAGTSTVSTIRGSPCIKSVYISSPAILVITARVPPYTTYIGKLVVARVG